MGIIDLQEEYIKYIKNRKKDIDNEILDLKANECMDEANLLKIRLNIIDIFEKMFSISKSDNIEEFHNKYLSYFDKIPKAWHNNREKALEFENAADVIIEDIKINEAKELKDKYMEYYNKI